MTADAPSSGKPTSGEVDPSSTTVTSDAEARDRKPAGSGTEELEPHQLDVQAPMTDDDLAQALEDTFPASDPINFAGSITGRPAETPSAAPIGTHPMAGSDEEARDADEAGNDPDRGEHGSGQSDKPKPRSTT